MVSKKIIVEDDGEEGDIPRGRVEICIEFENDRYCMIVYKALVPETINPPSYRSTTKIMVKDNCLKIEICSKDLISLRAAINSYLRWISLILTSLEEMKNELGGY